jgi:hypothetical protein
MTQARIYRPAKTAMQSGRANTHYWVLEFEPATVRRADPLMGWIGSDDTLGQVRLRFEGRDEAVKYAEGNGLDYRVDEPRSRHVKVKNYADNFRHDRID